MKSKQKTKNKKCAEGVRFRDGKYEINFRRGESPRFQKSFELKSLRAAKRLRARLMTEDRAKRKNGESVYENIDFETLKFRLLEDLKGDGLRKKTVNRIRLTFDVFFIEYLSQEYPKVNRLSGLPKEGLYNYKNYVVNTLGREKGWRSELSTLKGIFSRCTRMGLCNRELNDALKELKRPPKRQVQYIEITNEEKIKLLHEISRDKARYYAPTYFLMRLGWRVEETLSVKRKNITFVAGKPNLIKLDASVRKNRRDFVLETIDNGLSKVISKCVLDGRGSQYLFCNTRGNRITSNQYRDYLARISFRVLGKRLKPHDFRRSMVTESARNNMSIKDVMAITGHIDIKVLLEHYSYSTDEGREKVLKMSSF